MKKLIILAATIAALSGCSTLVQMRNFDENLVPQNANTTHTQESVGEAILFACKQLTWKCRIQETGKILGVLDIRKHQLRVNINYNAAQYDIDYKDSINLDYNGEKIHRQYVNWVTNLTRHIDSELAN
ncbi:MAG: hypothetical protein ACTH4U_19175 [Pseudoalteromonas prydzensis]|uniref:hypothetical protein n=1 Tax=Pseudoalteromonas prydzensis TaxID=182141 RepID=UPI003F9B85B0